MDDLVTRSPAPNDDREAKVTTLEHVRDAIAHAVLPASTGAPPSAPRRLGTITLRPHQNDALARLQRSIDECGGGMLADEVGLGKTYVALAVARDASNVVVVAPAALRDMWASAIGRADVRGQIITFETLSRGGARARIPSDPDLVIVDEAHHVRNPATGRYAALARLCARARVVLLSATPLQNRRRDLAAQLALFLGSRAWHMADDDLARCVVRRTREDVQAHGVRLPDVSPPEWLDLAAGDDRLDMLLALPPPVPASDGGDGGALLTYSLVRQWASSQAALRASLRRRQARAVGLIAALEAGRYPTQTELTAWVFGDGSVQLAFPELAASRIATVAAGHGAAANALLAAVVKHERAVAGVLQTLERSPDQDRVRADVIRSVRARHPGDRIVAFAESAETVEGLFRYLRLDGGVAMLRSRGAVVAGGNLSRREALARFAPLAQGVAAPLRGDRIDLLLTTDLLSEGVNLQDASVIIHLDLPWNPARLEQRVGRINRLGSPHPRIFVYAFRPPVGAERLLEVERRLRAKLAAADRTIGVVGRILPGFTLLDGAGGISRAASHVHATLTSWRTGATDTRSFAGGPIVAGVRAHSPGFIAALIDESRRPILLARVFPGAPTTETKIVELALQLASGPPTPVSASAIADAIGSIDRWVANRAADRVAGIDDAVVARARRRVLTRIASVTSRVPRHLRPIVSPLAAHARRVTTMPLAEGAERVLAELADAPLDDQAWLRALKAFGDLHARGPAPDVTDARPRLVAALVFLAATEHAD